MYPYSPSKLTEVIRRQNGRGLFFSQGMTAALAPLTFHVRDPAETLWRIVNCAKGQGEVKLPNIGVVLTGWKPEMVAFKKYHP